MRKGARRAGNRAELTTRKGRDDQVLERFDVLGGFRDVTLHRVAGLKSHDDGGKMMKVNSTRPAQ